MFKKIMLAVATFGIICVAYVIYQWQDASTTRTPRAVEPPVRTVTRRPVATQPAASRPEDASFSFKGARIPPGESPRVSVFDDKGNARYVFQCTGWKPLSDNEFHITNPTARLLLPGGQLAYVWADEGQVVFQRGDGNALNPKSGWLRGHVRIFIDRTRPKDREENPDRAALEQHPEAVVKIWLEDVSFDLDLDRLDSRGPVVVQSVDASIEGEGLELIWNEVDRRVRLLQINKGKRATLHSSKLAKFSFAGGSESPQQASAVPVPQREAPKPPPQAQPVEDDRSLAFQDLDAASATSPKEDRVDTYRIEFQGGVSARQTEGAKVVGSLSNADMLELLADIGREDRAAVEHAPGTDPADAKAAHTRPSAADAIARDGQMPIMPARSMVELEWSGKLIARPLEASEQPSESAGERLHLVARGTPVSIRDEQNGEASCTELEYHGETKQIWLRGTEAHPVRMDSASRGRLTVQKMTFDPKTGVASVDGPGRMLSDRRSRSQEVAGEPLDAGPQGEISWTRSALLEFGRAPAVKTAAAEQAAGEPKQRSEYIKRAVFDGNVAMRDGPSSIAAGHLEAFFAEPRPDVDTEGLVATRIAAHDNVTFEQRSERKGQAERVQCDRLEVEMDGSAGNLPKIARAFGNVIATQRGERSAREIRAGEQLVLTLTSVPRPITQEERQRLEVMARQNPDVKPGSPKWVALESKLAARRRTVARSMTASGQVVVNIRDNKDVGRNLGLIADTLDCTFSDDEEIQRALVVGSEERPASVDTGDVYVKGPQIIVDMDAQLVEVPGGGLMRFMTREDLDGRAVDRPVPVVVSWKDRMVMRGKENRGTFTGSVRAASETTILDCRELRIEFQDMARGDAPAARANSYWIFGPVVSAVGETRTASVGGLLTGQMRKRPVYLWAVGDAVIESSSFEQGPERGGAISGAFFRSMPMAWQASRPDTGKRGRLLSRLRAAGPQIRIDLVERHFGIEGVGNMSIEDYRIPQRSARSGGAGTGSLGAGRITGGLDSLGPSQTVFTWQSSMTYLNHRNLAVFDDSVKMNHVSGSAMVMQQELAAAMNLDPERLRKLESRQARLDCDNLLVEFDRDRTQIETGPSPLSRATKLKRFEAKGAVQLALDGGRQAVTGTVVTYASESGEVKVAGSPAWPAQILEQDERTAKLNVVRAEPGKAISWNEKTRIARIEGSSLLGTGR